MEEEDKLPLKRLEVSLTKFNDVAIPHHLELLRQHKANIIKYEALGQWEQVRAEQRRASRVASQLRSLLLELEALRGRVRDEDSARFHQLTRRSRDSTLRAIVDYLEASPNASMLGSSAGSAESVCVLAREPEPLSGQGAEVESEAEVRPFPEGEPLLQLQVDPSFQEVCLAEREALLRGWNELQTELRALHEVWQHAQAAALAQQEQVSVVASQVEVAADNVSAARQHLSAAAKLRSGAWFASCAVAGAALGGPLGALVGAKAAAGAALVGSFLGFAAAKRIAAPTPPDKDD